MNELSRTLAVRVEGALEVIEYEGDANTAELLAKPFASRTDAQLQRDLEANVVIFDERLQRGEQGLQSTRHSLAPPTEMGQRVLSITLAQAYRRTNY